MSLGAPQFLLLLPAFALAGWFFRGLQLWKPLRILLILIAVLALCDPSIPLKRGGIDLWVLLDRSLSARSLTDAGDEEWRSLLERSKPGRDNRLHLVDYAAEVVPVGDAETAVYSGDRGETRTALAIRDTLARMEDDRHNRILLFTDGYSTEPLGDLADRLVSAGVPLDHRILRAPDDTDYRLAAMTLPPRAQPAEPFVVDLRIEGSVDGPLPVSVFRGDRKLFTREVAVEGGTARMRFSDRIATPGAHLYRAVVEPSVDAFSGNNAFEQWIEIAGGPRVLLVTNYTDDPLATTLRAQGFGVEVVEDPLSLGPGMLAGARALVLNNVPAYEIPAEFLRAIPFFVEEQGGGFVMAGGKKSFGAGGYFESAVDRLLPVTMELKSEHRRLAVAMAIVMDRSGSMAMTTTSGHMKMTLANEGAARAVELLGESDAVTVFAVDSQAHRISELLNVGRNRGELIKRIRSVESMGGGIFVYTGMKAAWEELKKAEAGQRHLILFSDAADSEEPGEYKQLLEEMAADGATASVIGLGTRSDPDANFLQDIANRGSGRMFFTDQAGELPNIFAQETVSVARSTFVDEPVGTQSTGRWHELAQSDLEWLGTVGGYNLSYLREGDESALVTTDSYAAPLVAFGRRGLGKTAAISFPLGGDFSAEVRGWEEYGDFSQTLARWLIGEQVPSGIGVRHRIDGTELTIDLYYDPAEWSDRMEQAPPKLVLQRGYGQAAAEPLSWERLAPGHFSVTTSLRESEPVRGAVQIGPAALPFGPVSAGAAAEWAFDRDRIAELRETSRATGGGEILDLPTAWRKPPAPSAESIRNWFLAIGLLVFLLEAFVTRTGWKMPLPRLRVTARPPRKSTAAVKSGQPTVAVSKPKEKAEPVSSVDSPPDSDASPADRKSRFARAKKRR